MRPAPATSMPISTSWTKISRSGIAMPKRISKRRPQSGRRHASRATTSAIVAEPPLNNAVAETCSKSAMACGAATNPRLLRTTKPSPKVVLVRPVKRAICAVPTPAAPNTRKRTAPPVSAPKPMTFPRAEPAVAPIHSNSRGTLTPRARRPAASRPTRAR